jgi:hypothetical protein
MAKNTTEETNVNEVGGTDVGVSPQSFIPQAAPVSEKTDAEYIAGLQKLRDVSVEDVERYVAAINRRSEKILFNKNAMSSMTKERLMSLQKKFGYARPRFNISKEIGGVRVSVMPGNRPIMKTQENGYQASIPEWNIPFNLYIVGPSMSKGFSIPARDAINVKNVLNQFFEENRELMEFGRDFSVDIEQAEANMKKSFDVI